MNLYRVACPMNRLRLALVVGMVAAFSAAFLVPWGRELFELTGAARLDARHGSGDDRVLAWPARGRIPDRREVPPPMTTPDEIVPLRAATRAWAAVSLQTFGGPAGQIAVMHRGVRRERRWIGERRFLHALSYCTVLPGPEAQQLRGVPRVVAERHTAVA